MHEDASLVPERCLGMVARLAISICLTLPNNYYNPSPNIHVTEWRAESNPFTICFVKSPMENIPFSRVAGGLTVLQRTNSTHSKGEGIGGKCLERENIWPTEAKKRRKYLEKENI